MKSTSIRESQPRVATERNKPHPIFAVWQNLGFILLIAFIVAFVLIRVQGFAPIPTLFLGFEYSLGSLEAVARTLAWSLPLMVAALGVALAFRSGMFNIGAEGQIYAGAMAAALAGAYVGPMFTGLHLLVCTAAAAVVGALIAGSLAWLRAVWNVDEVVSTLLSNYIVVLFCTYLATGPLSDPTRQSGTTEAVAPTAMFSEIVPRTGLTWSIAFVTVVALGVWWLSERSVTGYRWRMTGSSPGFASAVGIKVTRARLFSMMASGALAAVAGSLLVTASQGRYWTEIGTGIGWDAVLMALVARARPIPTVIWVLGYAIMRSTARGIEQVSTVPAELSNVLVAAIIVAVVAKSGMLKTLGELLRRFQNRKEV